MRNDTEIDELLAIACRAADVARPITLAQFRDGRHAPDNKHRDGGFDPVTQADRDAETAIRAVLAEARPDDAILGEEFGAKSGRSGLTWVIDPIDGTRAYITGTPTWGTLISVSDENGPLLGLIDQPYTDERFVGAPGGAALYRGDHRSDLRVAPADNLAEAALFSTFPEIGTEAERRAFEALSQEVRLTRFGIDCYAYALLAAGQIDLVVEAGLNAYDIQAPIAVIEAAGGIVTDWRGGPAHKGGQVIAAASAKLHRAALQILSPLAGP